MNRTILKTKAKSMDQTRLMSKIQNGLVSRSKEKPRTRTKLKFVANTWINNSLGSLRTEVIVGNPTLVNGSWVVGLHKGKRTNPAIGKLTIDNKMHIIKAPSITKLKKDLKKNTDVSNRYKRTTQFITNNHSLTKADCLTECQKIKNGSIELLLTDPPYGISNQYASERQIPRRVRANGGDFIMPKGDFGSWDHNFSPDGWTNVILPKIGGWAVIFCSHVQIKEYSDILEKHGFVAIGALVWHKTNPVPFNHKFKPLNAWETAVYGKRPGTKFNGKSVHNVFTYKSPSPQHRIHPTQKPLGLMEELIELLTDKGDTVLDPFAGSATTTLAAINKGRKSIAFENNDECYNRALSRLKSHILAFN